ncbi:hypothetical protein VS868_11820 [Salinimicrobium sp. 3283s]|uniref:hypothetical protein n=1 Tax=Salinimicrobium sp. 3283s TaxID=3114359 RepID=UPI0031EA9FE8
MTTTTHASTVFPGKAVAKDVQFLMDLEKILKPGFGARIYPDSTGNVVQAKVNTDQALDQESIKKLIAHTAKWNLNMVLSRSGAGLKVLFTKENN